MISPARTRVMLALLAVYARDGRATVRSVAAEDGRATTTTYWHLFALADEGLVGGIGTDKRGALRPLVTAVPMGAQ